MTQRLTSVIITIYNLREWTRGISQGRSMMTPTATIPIQEMSIQKNHIDDTAEFTGV